MRRFLRCIAALGHVDEVDADSFAANKFTHTWTTEKAVCGARFSFEFATPAWNAIPAYLKFNKYQNPTDTNSTPTQLGFNSFDHFFELLGKHDMTADFAKLMSAFRTGRAEFLEVYSFAKRILHDWDNSSTLLVDVGGGRGHDVEKILQQHPATAGHMALQDRPDVATEAVRPEMMEVMAHDFFQPQPIKGARAYYMRMILHDWPDDLCVAILRHLAAAMTSGYSTILVNDIVMPEKGATRFMTQSDFAMMIFSGAMERHEQQWRQLFERAGLKVVGLWKATPESVFELSLAA